MDGTSVLTCQYSSYLDSNTKNKWKKKQSHFKEVDHKRLTICQTQVCLTHTHKEKHPRSVFSHVCVAEPQTYWDNLV